MFPKETGDMFQTTQHVKVKLSLSTPPRHRAGGEVYLHSFLNLVLDQGSPTHRPPGCIMWPTATYVNYVYTTKIGDRGSTVVKVLCYKSEGRWFDPSWCHWIFR